MLTHFQNTSTSNKFAIETMLNVGIKRIVDVLYEKHSFV